MFGINPRELLIKFLQSPQFRVKRRSARIGDSPIVFVQT